MHKRLNGLRHECDLLAAEIELYKAGEKREIDTGRSGRAIDITDLWIENLRAQLAFKRSLVSKLKDHYARIGEIP